jgi:hypothetical protein
VLGTCAHLKDSNDDCVTAVIPDMKDPDVKKRQLQSCHAPVVVVITMGNVGCPVMGHTVYVAKDIVAEGVKRKFSLFLLFRVTQRKSNEVKVMIAVPLELLLEVLWVE